MPLSEKFSELAAYIASPEYLLTARHPDHSTAFTRDRKLPLASLEADVDEILDNFGTKYKFAF